MRTREEQVDNLTDALDVFDSNHPEKSAIYGYKRHADAQNIAQQHIVEAEQRGYERARAECAADTRRLDYLGSSCCDVRFRAEPIADTGDADTYCDIIEHHMAEPKERIVGSAYTIRAAIDAAMEGWNG